LKVKRFISAAACAVAAIGIAFPAAANAASAHRGSASPDVTCSTEYYFTNSDYGNSDHMNSASPYYLSFGSSTTHFCRESGGKWEQVGTSRCMIPSGNDIEEGNCADGSADWTITVGQFEDTGGDCITDNGNTRASLGACANDPQTVMTIHS
jgi:hypothetical protein